MAQRKKHYVYVWDTTDGKWVLEFESYQYTEARLKHWELLKLGYEVDYRYEYPGEEE